MIYFNKDTSGTNKEFQLAWCKQPMLNCRYTRAGYCKEQGDGYFD